MDTRTICGLSPEVSCSTTAMIYHLTCHGCALQYVGKTDHPLKARKWHYANSKSAMAIHQHEEVCRGFDIKILEQVPNSDDIIAFEDLWIKLTNP